MAGSVKLREVANTQPTRVTKVERPKPRSGDGQQAGGVNSQVDIVQISGLIEKDVPTGQNEYEKVDFLPSELKEAGSVWELFLGDKKIPQNKKDAVVKLIIEAWKADPENKGKTCPMDPKNPKSVPPEILLQYAANINIFLKAPGVSPDHDLSELKRIAVLATARAIDKDRSAAEPPKMQLVKKGEIRPFQDIIFSGGKLYQLIINSKKEYSLLRMDYDGKKFFPKSNEMEIVLPKPGGDPMYIDLAPGGERLKIYYEVGEIWFFLENPKINEPLANERETGTVQLKSVTPPDKSDNGVKSYDEFKASVIERLASGEKGTIIHLIPDPSNPESYLKMALDIFPKSEGYIVGDGQKGIFIYHKDPAKLPERLMNYAERIGEPVSFAVKRIETYNSTVPEEILEINLNRIERATIGAEQGGVQLIRVVNGEYRVLAGGKWTVEAKSQQRQADDYIRKVASEYLAGRKNEIQVRRQLERLGISPEAIDLRIADLRLARIEARYGKGTADYLKGHRVEIAQMRVEKFAKLMKSLYLYRKGSVEATQWLEDQGIHDPEFKLRKELQLAHEKYVGYVEAERTKLKEVKQALSGEGRIDEATYQKYSEWVRRLEQKPNIMRELNVKADEVKKMSEGLEAAKMAGRNEVPAELDQGLKDIERVTRDPKTAGRLIYYLKANPELLKGENGEKFLKKLNGVLSEKNFAEALKREGSGLLVGLVVLIGVEEFMGLVGIENKQARFVAGLGLAHLATVYSQDVIIKVTSGLEAAQAQKIMSYMENPTLRLKVVSQLKGLGAGLAEMGFYGMMAEDVVKIFGVNDPNTLHIAKLAGGLVGPSAVRLAAPYVFGESALARTGAGLAGRTLAGRLAIGIGVANLATDGLYSLFASDYRMHVNKRAYDEVQTNRVRTTGGKIGAFVVEFFHGIGGSMSEAAATEDNPRIKNRIVQEDISMVSSFRSEILSEVKQFLNNSGDLSVLTTEQKWGNIMHDTERTDTHTIRGGSSLDREWQGMTYETKIYESVSELEIYNYLFEYAKQNPNVQFGGEEHINAVVQRFGKWSNSDEYKVKSQDVRRIFEKGIIISWQMRLAAMNMIDPTIFSDFENQPINDDIRGCVSRTGVLRTNKIEDFRKIILTVK